MTLGERNELPKHEEDHQDPREVQRPVDAQLSEAEEEEEGLSPPSSTYSPLFSGSSPSSSSSSSYFALYPGTPEEGSAAGSPSPPQSPLRACPSPSALAGPPWSQSEDSFSTSDEERWGTGVEREVAPPVAQEGFHVKAVDLVAFLLHKYRAKQPTSKAEMLEVITPEYQDDFPVIWGQASECMQLVFGLDLIEVDPIAHSYVLVTVLGLSYDGMLSGEQGLPKTGLLVLLLGVILLEGDCVPEEKVWEAVGVIGVFAGKQHLIYGEPGDLLTHVWVQEGYVEYRQVAGSDPTRYEFLWGPRAYEETSKLRVMEYLLHINSRQPAYSPAQSKEERRSDEEEGA
ncbi:melanoma-associated antigen 8-like [Canis lupus baileyi]|uniref:MAGE domain-containing protein n=1 Tax=Canis lupus familiaris TaxID=9615 RepID=A0A8I3PKI2_CANLF|nr:melanoma-associated antigen 10-like isoform X2 [Canis lupus dingo]XP_025316574.1 melanoma-associated antigen 10-like isoform X2 [Canis lupus dingo]XP_025316575.1 melanoma-associated antigen 10-like isoform X2 [Canis lupus dingo]XP_025316576.1 melanoma-associated antigen 10-like isoform X2 [Canis lupus dingo]XP_025316577.1 melanoma-associated antigen 10-like isoform X2 [Canis lupus dingo]XP_025316578.1 melanoma-associated antigen 10-like isoform X2 [Canis lupus dingo]XP_025316580.1 melanoma|eukprot:XP_005641971.1 melanoma-associated antigen 10-like [Canis lupus familiaris]